MTTVTVARHAMATRFEMVLHGERPVALRAAAEEALDEIDRLEAQLSLYRPSSELSHLNAHAAHEAVVVEPGLFRLLLRARQAWEASGGAFDITVAPLLRCWGFLGDSGRKPELSELEEARAKVGMHLVHLDKPSRSVRFARAGVMLDLGSIGKGFALERAIQIIEEAGVASALIHGGTSTTCALGVPPEAEAWKVAIEHPALAAGPAFSLAGELNPAPSGRAAVLTVVSLRDESLSVSAVWGKGFESGGRIYGHVIDPRTGAPAVHALLAAVVHPSSTESDAWSTVLLILGEVGHDLLASRQPGLRTFLVQEGPDSGTFRISHRGQPPLD